MNRVLRLLDGLSLLDQTCRQVFDPQPEAAQARIAGQGQEILVLEDVELGSLRGKGNRFAERLVAHLAACHGRECPFDRLAMAEEVVVGAEEAGNAAVQRNPGDLLDHPLRTAVAEGELVVAGDGTVRTMELAAVRGDHRQDLVRGDRFARPGPAARTT